ncbi:hypothetical protein HPB50_013568 [Hyalomma asiaticum]|uniref:Uncharacterized protein n=1 Tax=Hyalomma asiaticum TaxID=266040 RepID=A0ACB7RKV5_HYAAI|nr:hypothetical protein HPB50_013568 [Hyalomma asiaticum]
MDRAGYSTQPIGPVAQEDARPSSAGVAAIQHLKLPPFCPDCTCTWLLQVEAHFRLRKSRANRPDVLVDTLTEMADRVANYSRAHSLNAVTTSPPAAAADPALASIDNPLDALFRQDARLDWLEHAFIAYVEDLRDASKDDNFYSKETCHDVLFTTQSNVTCIHLVIDKKFKFLLTRKTLSEAIEDMFALLRRSAGCDDALDVGSTISGLEKILKTGTVAAFSRSNVHSSANVSSTQLLPIQQARCTSTPTADELILNTAATPLREHVLSERPILSNLDVASLAMIGCFVVSALRERIACAECVAMLQAPNSSAPNHGLVAHHDCGGLFYPIQELVKALVGLRRFADCVLSQRRLQFTAAVIDDLIASSGTKAPAVVTSPILFTSQLVPAAINTLVKSSDAYRSELIYRIAYISGRPCTSPSFGSKGCGIKQATNFFLTLRTAIPLTLHFAFARSSLAHRRPFSRGTAANMAEGRAHGNTPASFKINDEDSSTGSGGSDADSDTPLDLTW